MKWLALVLALFASPVFPQELFKSFNSNVAIAQDGTMVVIETIVAQVEGQQIKRGILRDFPTDYRDRLGRRVTVPFEVLAVTRDGAAETYSTSRQANGVSVRIGHPNVMLPHGRHLYQITYKTKYQLGFFDTHDELYWNVNGNGWTFAMEEISAEVSLPAAVPAKDLKLEAYTGAFGARGRDYTAEARDGGASFRTTQLMRQGEGLTIVVMFPKGIVAPPTRRDMLDRWLKDNRGEAAGSAGLLVFLAFLYWRWTSVGRDPRSGPVFPRYEAPKGLGPAGVRYLDKMACDDRCFASSLLGLGQRGFLNITEAEGVYRIRPTGAKVEWLPGDAPIAGMVGAGVDIGRTYDPAVQQARAALDAELKRFYGEKLFARNSGSIVVGTIIGGAVIFMMIMASAAPLVAGGFAAVMVAALFVAAKLMPAYTVEGRRLEDEVEGLRQYLSVAEKDDLARMKMPPRTKEEFARFLPYAVALGVEKTWADAFTRVLGAAGLAAATAGYYSTTSSSGSMFSSSSGFASSLADMGGTISSASTAPGASSGGSDSGGGGGGGDSGGGGGGGGGSGW